MTRKALRACHCLQQEVLFGRAGTWFCFKYCISLAACTPAKRPLFQILLLDGTGCRMAGLVDGLRHPPKNPNRGISFHPARSSTAIRPHSPMDESQVD